MIGRITSCLPSPMFRRSSERSGWRRRFGVAFGVLVGLCLGAPVAVAQDPAAERSLALPPDPPETHLGFRPGTDRRVADWDQVTRYLTALAARSDRVRLDTIGRSTLDRPMLLLTISDPANLVRVEELRAVQATLADPRRIASPEQRAALIRDGRLVVLITAAIHPTEVGATLAPLTIAYRLASASDAATLAVLRETVVLIVPSLNPDGVDLVADWYRESVSMPWEGEPPPFLYHHYAGHDNNRDWYAFTQVETINVVERVYNQWFPHIVHDMHQQEATGSRYFVPPWLDPVEPNVDPLLIGAANALGTSIAWEMQRRGKTGVAVHARYDAWGPARAFPHYHAGVRILSETASARLATPIVLRRDELDTEHWPGPGRTWNQPSPWRGGRWSISDVVAYMETGALALLEVASARRETWLDNFVRVGERAIGGWPEWPAAWVVTAGRGDRAGLAELTRIFHAARVEMRVAVDSLRVGSDTYPPGSLVIEMRQPYAAFAQAMLARQPYPGGRAHPGGPPRTPYDATAHNLPLFLGVAARSVDELPTGELELLAEPLPPPAQEVDGLSGNPALFVGLYQPWVPSNDEGWTRWVFDRYQVPYATLHDQEIRQGDLLRRFTAIVLPSLEPELLEDGWAAGSMPAGYTGGLGSQGTAALREFVEQGGTLVALGEATDYAIESLGLQATNRLSGQPANVFFTTGAQVRLEVDTATAVGRGVSPITAAWLDQGAAFDVPAGSGAERVATYGSPARVLSGWVHGATVLGGAAAVLDVPLGAGRVVLFGIRPQYRGQALVTFPLLFNSLIPRP